MKFCQKCGKELFDEAVICPQCGTPTKNYADDDTDEQAETSVSEIKIEKGIKTFAFDWEFPDKWTTKEINAKPLNVDLLFHDDTVVIQVLDKHNNLINTINIPFSEIVLENKIAKAFLGQYDCLVLKYSNGAFTFRTLDVNKQNILFNNPYTRMLSKSAQKTVDLNDSRNITIDTLRKIESLIKERK